MDNLSHYLSILYAILVTVGYIPGLIALVKSDSVKGVSSYFWYLIVATVGISFYNLLLTDALMFQVVSVGLNLTLGIVCLLVASYRKKDYFSIPFIIVFSLLLFLLSDFTALTQTIATITIILAYVTQITTFYKTKSAEGTNRFLFLIIGLGLASLIASMVLTHTYVHIIATEFVNFVLILICYLQANYYSRR